MSSTCFEPCRPGDVKDASGDAGSVAEPSNRLVPAHAHAHAGHAHAHGHTHGDHSHDDAHDHGGAGHSHGPGGHGAQRRADGRRLWVALLISGSIALVEAVGGWMSGSLALLSDAGHMLGDVSALGLSLFALWIAGKPADAKRTYGYYRMEILSALANGVLLLGVTLYILYEAWQRLQSPTEVHLGLMASVAVVGLVANLLSLWVLGHSHSHNVRGAFLHVLGDTLSSVGVLIAAAVIALTGWTPIDALLSAVIAVVIVVSALRLVRESVDVLLEAVPPHVDMSKVRDILSEMDGVIAVHDLHVWTISSGIYALSVHLVVADSRACDNDAILNEARKRLIEVCGVDHTTIQIEGEHFAHAGDVH